MSYVASKSVNGFTRHQQCTLFYQNDFRLSVSTYIKLKRRATVTNLIVIVDFSSLRHKQNCVTRRHSQSFTKTNRGFETIKNVSRRYPSHLQLENEIEAIIISKFGKKPCGKTKEHSIHGKINAWKYLLSILTKIRTFPNKLFSSLTLKRNLYILSSKGSLESSRQ